MVIFFFMVNLLDEIIERAFYFVKMEINIIRSLKVRDRLRLKVYPYQTEKSYANASFRQKQQ